MCTGDRASACAQQRVQPRATRSTTCSLLAGPLRCCRPASGSLRRATPSWTILGAIASARTLATAHHAHPEHIHAQPSHYRSPLLTVLVFRALSQCLPSGICTSSDSSSDGRAARGVCVHVCACCVHCGQLEPAVPPEKTALKLVEISANASQNAIFFSGAARRRPSAGRREKKLRFLGKKCDLANFDIFSKKKPDGSSFM